MSANDGELGNELRMDWPAKVLKVYGRRRSRFREALSGFSHLLLERKRGVRPEERWETERSALLLWNREGFRVPRILDDPPPSDVGGRPSLWLERVDGRTLFWLTVDPEVPLSRKEELVTRLGQQHSLRHRRARDLGEPLLLHEHPTTKHILLSGDELVTIDLEGGYLPDYPIMLGVAHELAGFLRPLWIGDTPCLDAPLPRAYLRGYGDLDLISDACRAWFSWRSWQWVRRRSDHWRRGERSKSVIMEQLRSRLRSGSVLQNQTCSRTANDVSRPCESNATGR